jgi:predicted ribosome quality control (RQC) complex YloA/Tae2 family protein
MKNTPLVLVLSALLLLNACALLPKPAPRTETAQSYETMLREAERLFALRGEAQQRELARLDKDDSREGRMQKAMFYVLTNSQYCSSLDPAALTAGDTKREKKWDQERRALARQLKESQEENQKLAQKAQDEQQRANDLQQKLDELKNIERSLGNREQGTRK